MQRVEERKHLNSRGWWAAIFPEDFELLPQCPGPM